MQKWMFLLFVHGEFIFHLGFVSLILQTKSLSEKCIWLLCSYKYITVFDIKGVYRRGKYFFFLLFSSPNPKPGILQRNSMGETALKSDLKYLRKTYHFGCWSISVPLTPIISGTIRPLGQLVDTSRYEIRNLKKQKPLSKSDLEYKI